VLGFATLVQLEFADDELLTVQQVRNILTRYNEFPDAKTVADVQRLVDAGPRAHKVLTELLNETDDPILIDRIFAVFAVSSGDKTVALREITNTLGRYKGLDTNSVISVRLSAVQTLGRIGSEAAINVLQDMLQDSNEQVRFNVIRELSKKADVKRLEIIEKFIKSRSKSSSAEALERDRSVREAKEAADRMRRQLRNDKSRKVTE
jgi:HEAT repeat protein